MGFRDVCSCIYSDTYRCRVIKGIYHISKCCLKQSLSVCCLCRTSRRRWLCSMREPSGSPGVWSRSRSPWAVVSLADMFGWSEPLGCISTSSAATTTSWRATCSGHRSTRRTHLTMELFTTSGLNFYSLISLAPKNN